MTVAANSSAQDGTARLGPGVLLFVVGPSGAGKDTLLRLAKAHFAGSEAVLFPRRLITRGPDPHEDHDCVDAVVLREAVANGDVALAWSAHGLDYAVPAAVDDAVRAGKVVVVNVSRKIVLAAARKYRRVVVAVVTAPAEVLAERLRSRGRETIDDVAQRLDRHIGDDLSQAVETHVVENVGDPSDAAETLVALINGLIGAVAGGGPSA